MRIQQLLDRSSFVECSADLSPVDPPRFIDRIAYRERLLEEQCRVGALDAAVVGSGSVMGIPVVFGLTDSRFLKGSMGPVVGEKPTRAIELATRDRLPLIILSSSSGARIQEGIVSLMQMAKVAAALARHDAAGGLFISLLTDPTIAGASFAYLADVVLAEPAALVGFASRRLIARRAGTNLPQRSQTSEAYHEHGFIGHIVHRRDQRDVLFAITQVPRTRSAKSLTSSGLIDARFGLDDAAGNVAA